MKRPFSRIPVNFDYSIRTKSEDGPRILMIWDRSEPLGGRSVTNAVEEVLTLIEVQTEIPKIVIYCDSMGHWDQIVHSQGEFVIFQPIPRGHNEEWVIDYAFSLAEK